MTYLSLYYARFSNTYKGASRGCVARLNSDGSLDTSFLATGTGADNYVFSVALQSNGKILIGGCFTTYNGIGRGHVARLNSDGSLDTSFLATGTGADGYVHSIALQSDGKILIGGFFYTYNGTSRRNIARLNSDGSLDTSFQTTGAGWVQDTDIVPQSDGKILINGCFGAVARLNSDGSLDTSFLTTETGIDNAILSIALQSDGKVLIGGFFPTYNGTSRGNIARLNSDGSLDNSFLAIGAGTDYTVCSIALQIDGKILIGGRFTTYNGYSSGHIARLWGD